jgi:hypothetical protein
MIECEYKRRFEFMTWFIDHFDAVRDYILQFNITHTLVSTVTFSLPLFSSDIL